MQRKLTTRESNRYAVCLKTVKDGIQSVWDVGAALHEISEHKLYREEFETFEEFAKEMFAMSRAQAYRMIEAAEVKMSPMGDKIQNERQARELAKADPEDRPQVVAAALKTGHGALTARGIANAVNEPKPEPVEAIRTDKVGREIPESILAEWDRADEVGTELRSMARKIKCRIERGLEDEDPAFAEITNPLVVECSGIHYSLSQILPYAVCATCQGRGVKKCLHCKGRGFISKFYWDSFVPSDVKQVLAKGRK